VAIWSTVFFDRYYEDDLDELDVSPGRAAAAGPTISPSGVRTSSTANLAKRRGSTTLRMRSRHAFANGRIKHTKTRLSTHAVPLQAKAVDALDRLPASANPILFPNMRGGRVDFRIFGRKHWRSAQIKDEIEPIRGLYDLRHTYATFALRAGVPVFAASRSIGSSIAMIDRHYGHLALTAANTPSPSWTRSPSSGRWTLRGRRTE
jgi:site-specific recombinase XerD